MVLSPPCKHLKLAVVALAAMHTQQTLGYSMYYAPETTSGTTNKISTKFPAYGAEVTDQDCAITVKVDPTLPNITTISTVPVKFHNLLANVTKAPAEAVSTKVGRAVVKIDTPASDTHDDTYATSGDGSKGGSGSGDSTTTAPDEKIGITSVTTAPATDTPPVNTDSSVTTAPSSDTGGDSDSSKGSCGVRNRKSKTRKVRDSAVSGLEHQTRRLEASANKDIVKLEAYYGTTMETTLANLPKVGVHKPSPWPGPYWPTYQDNINVVWSEREPSPSEKYATAFGLDVEDFKNKVSKDNGIDSQSNRRKCSTDDDCKSLNDTSVCSIRDGQSSGYCIPTWFGICHAWAPAAILESEPNCSVTHNGVTFQPMDLKALVSNIYDGASVSTVFTGARYNGGNDTKDEYGRHLDSAYRDLNPGYFHVAAANILGKLNSTFIADVTAGAAVWNQPVRGFKVYEQTEMSLKQAAETFYGLEKYPWNAAAKSIVYMKTRLSWIIETYTDGGLVSSGEVNKFTAGDYYYYLLELDDAGAIIGGEWVYNSNEDHPDFLWIPKAKPAADTVTSIGLSYADVSMLLEKSVSCSNSSSSGSSSASSAGDAGSASIDSSSAGFADSSSIDSSSAGFAGSTSTSASTAGSGSVSTGSDGFAGSISMASSSSASTDSSAAASATEDSGTGSSSGRSIGATLFG